MIRQPIGAISGEDAQKKMEFIKVEFFDKRQRFLCEFPIVVGLLLESQGLWRSYAEFYETGSVPKKAANKSLNQFRQTSTAAEELLKLVKYNRNMVKLAKKVFWKSMEPEEYDQLPIEAKVTGEGIKALELKFSSKVEEFSKAVSESLGSEDDTSTNLLKDILEVLV